MEFIRNLEEAKLTRNPSTFNKLSYSDICENVYLCLLIVELMRKYQPYNIKMMEYTKNTESYSSFKYFKVGSTDLHNFIYIITGGESALALLNDPSKAKKEQLSTTFPMMAINRYFKQISHDNNPTNVYHLFTSIERGLHIKNSEYKSIRKIITNRTRTEKTNVKYAARTLLRFANTNLKQSDLIQHLTQLVNTHNFELASTNKVTNDTNPIIKNDDLYYIAEIVGYSNVFMAIKFLDLLDKGETIPANVQSGFSPAIQLLVDIIKGGPAYVNTLKALQREAKRTTK